MTKATIKINDQINLCVDICGLPDEQSDYVAVGLVYAKTGEWFQDLALIKNDMEYDETTGIKNISNNFKVNVFADPNSDDATDSFIIPTYSEKNE